MAKEVFIIGCMHFNHDKILIHRNDKGDLERPEFQSVKEMNEMLLDNYASVVKNGDIVYNLGDVNFGDIEYFKTKFRKLPGSQRLIFGNHDDHVEMINSKVFGRFYSDLPLPDHGLFLSHRPVHITELKIWGTDRYMVNVHAHIHRKKSPDGPYFNCSVEMTDYKPVHIEDIKSKIKSWQL